MQNINLIPEKEVQEQTQTKAVQFSTWFSIVLLVVMAGLSAYYIYQTSTLNSRSAALKAEIITFREKITSMAQVEVGARNLDQKYSTIKDLFANRVLYSMLVAEMLARSPEGITIDSLTIQKGGKMNITGHADNYISIANFTNNLVDSDYAKGNPVLKAVYTTVTLNSVSLEKARNQVAYSINLELNQKLLNKK